VRSRNPILGRRDAFGSGRAEYGVPYPAANQQGVTYQPAETPYGVQAGAVPAAQPMTLDDVVVRTGFCLGTVFAAGAVSWIYADRAWGLVIPALIAGLILGLVISFRAITHPLPILAYCACEGVALGAISRLYEDQFKGIVPQAVIGTAGVFAAMLGLYKSGRVRATPRFVRAVLGAMIGVFVLMAANWIAYLFSSNGLGLRSGGGLAIVFSLVCIGVAAMTFILDFAAVEQGVHDGISERWAWYAAFGITVGLIWLYLEILRLLAYLRR
jgi:uncharacterized YccA/Bax inhibitor family protein